MGELHNLPETYYNRLRADGVEAGDSFEAMRSRFPAFDGVPEEVGEYRTIMADAYQEELCGYLYTPGDVRQLELTLSLIEQGAIVRVALDQYKLTEAGRGAGEVAAKARYIAENGYPPQRGSEAQEEPIYEPTYNTAVPRGAGWIGTIPLLIVAYIVFKYL